MSSASRSSTIKVGVLTLVSLALLVFSLLWLRGRGLAGGETYTVLFKDVDGMREGSAVQMMGIRVGFVDRIQAEQRGGRYYVRVTFNINPDLGVTIPKGSLLAIEQSGIIGEKFLEVTPPQLREITLSTFKTPAQEVKEGLPVKFLYEEGYMEVGKVEKVDKQTDANLVRHRLYYRITRPGALMPEDPLYELVLDENQHYFLRILPSEPVLVQAPDPNLIFTVENPLRMKRFLEIQMESAEALKVTNEKITQLFSDETIGTLQNTVKNTEILTARANDVLDSANKLFTSTSRDLEQLVAVSQELAVNVNQVSNNINTVIGDPKLQADLKSTVASLEQSTNSLNTLLSDPALAETIALTRDTSRNAAELVSYLRTTAHDTRLHERLDKTMTLMTGSLTRLDRILADVEGLTDDDDQSLKGIITDTRQTAENLKRFSDTINKRFTLFRLMF